MFSEDRKKSGAIKKLLSLVRLELWRISVAGICMGIVAISTAAYAYLVGPVIKSLFLHDGPPSSPGTGLLADLTDRLSGQSAAVIGLLILIAAVIKGVAFYFERILTIRAGQRILQRLRADIYRGVLSGDPIHRTHGTPGELVSRFTVDVETIEQAVSKGLLAMLRDGLQVLALASLAFILSPTLGLVGLVALPPIAILIARISRSLRRRKGQVYDAFSRIGQEVEETSTGLKIIQSFGAENTAAARFAQKNSSLMKKTIRALGIKAFSSPLNEILGAAALALTLWYAHHQIDVEALQPEAFISFFTALFLLYQPVKGLGLASHTMAGGAAALDRVEPIARQTGRSPLDAFNREPRADGLTVSGVTVGYGKEKPVLKDFSLTLKPGEKTALVGTSGAGKSTLLFAIAGYLPLKKGGIAYPKTRTGGLPVAPVFQEPFLFNDTIRINVMLGNPEATLEALHRACQTAGVYAFAEDPEQILEMNTGPGGSALSLGQRQRVCIARALISDAPVLLLDEVTASLDGETEQTMVAELAARETDRTILVVTHRISTARWCDRVVLLDRGTVSLDGDPEALLSSDETMKRLFGAQVEEATKRGRDCKEV